MNSYSNKFFFQVLSLGVLVGGSAVHLFQKLDIKGRIGDAKYGKDTVTVLQRFDKTMSEVYDLFELIGSNITTLADIDNVDENIVSDLSSSYDKLDERLDDLIFTDYHEVSVLVTHKHLRGKKLLDAALELGRNLNVLYCDLQILQEKVDHQLLDADTIEKVDQEIDASEKADKEEANEKPKRKPRSTTSTSKSKTTAGENDTPKEKKPKSTAKSKTTPKPAKTSEETPEEKE